MKKIVLWPFFVWFAILFIFLGIFGGLGFFALLLGLLLLGVSHHCRLVLDDHFMTTYDGLFRKWRVIIEKKSLRLVEGKRALGNCWILDDRTSTQEIVLYRWMFSSDQIKKIEIWIAASS